MFPFFRFQVRFRNKKHFFRPIGRKSEKNAKAQRIGTQIDVPDLRLNDVHSVDVEVECDV